MDLEQVFCANCKDARSRNRLTFSLRGCPFCEVHRNDQAYREVYDTFYEPCKNCENGTTSRRGTPGSCRYCHQLTKKMMGRCRNCRDKHQYQLPLPDYCARCELEERLEWARNRRTAQFWARRGNNGYTSKPSIKDNSMPETLHELRMTSEAEVLLDARERNKSSTIQPDCTSPRLNSLADAHLQSMRPNPSPYGPRPEQRLKNISDLPVDTTACEVLERERQNKPLKGCFFLHAPDSHSLVQQWMHYSDIMYRQHSNPRSPLNHIRWPFEHAETLQMQLLARQGSGGEAALVLKKVTILPFTALVCGYYASAMTGYGLEPAKTSPRQQSGAPKLLAYQAAALSDADVFS